MQIQYELEAIVLPPMYKRNGQDCFFDPYREKLIPVTPEEIIRQKIAQFQVGKSILRLLMRHCMYAR